MREVQEAREVIARFLAFGGAVDREQVVAYALLEAFVSHWPALACAEDGRLLRAAAFVLEAEPQRCYKQRRLALSRLAEILR